MGVYQQPTGVSPLTEVVERLAAAEPTDRANTELTTYKALKPPWNDWDHLAARGRAWAAIVADVAMGEVQT